MKWVYKMKNKKSVIVSISAVLIVAILLSAVVFFAVKTSVRDTDIVATVNGLEICAEEFKLQMSAQKGYYIDENGEVDVEKLKSKALDYLIRYKVEQQEAVKCGAIKREETSYNALVSAMEKENIQRSQKIAAGQPVYGVKQYTYGSYFTYTYSNMQLDVREKLGKKGNALYATDDELKLWYDSVKAERYPKYDTLKLDYYKITWSDAISPEEAESTMKEVREQVIDSGTHDYCDPEYQELIIDDDNIADLQKTSPQFFEAVDNMKVGDVTEVISENDSSFFAVLKSAKKAGYKALEDYKDSIYTEYITEKYETYIDALVKSAKVEKTDKFKYLKLD